MDPNEQTIRARTDSWHWPNGRGLAVTNGGALVFDGINLFATPFTFNASRKIHLKTQSLTMTTTIYTRAGHITATGTLYGQVTLEIYQQ